MAVVKVKNIKVSKLNFNGYKIKAVTKFETPLFFIMFGKHLQNIKMSENWKTFFDVSQIDLFINKSNI